MPPRAATRTLSTAEERRTALVDAAIPVFAEHGFRAASTIEIARAAGISQAYLFRLFPKKVDLFLAVCEKARERMLTAFREADEDRDPAEEPLAAMGMAYRELLEEDRDLLLIQLQSQVTSGEPRITRSMQRTFSDLYELIAARSGASDEEIQAFFAQGMLMNVLAAMNALELDAPWARALCAKEGDA
jgi:AcrR family transcriptional regulator